MIPVNYAIFGKSIPMPSTATTNTLVGPTLTGTAKYSDCIRGVNGKLYFIPNTAAYVLEFDPATGFAVDIGTNFGTANASKWSCGILAENGKIYCIPLNHPKVMVIDTAAGTTTEIGTNYVQGTTNGNPGFAKWQGGGLASDKNIYGIPRGYSQILKINPATDTTSLVGAVLPLYGEKYSYGCFTNGKIYGMPNTNTNVLVFDIATSTTSYISTTLGATAYKLSGCAVALNGKIYTSPNTQSSCLVIDPVSATSSLISSTSGNGDCILGKNGKVYFIPIGNSKLIEIDTTLSTSNAIGTALTGTSHVGTALTADGKIYTSPSNDTRIEEIEILDVNILGTDLQVPSDLSTLANSNYNRYYNNR